MGQPMGAPWTCSQILTLEEEVGISQAKFQLGDYFWDGHGGPT